MAVLNLAGIAAAVAAEIPLIIEDGIEREILGRPSFIADGAPESLPGQIGQGAARSACRQYAAGTSGLTGQAAANAETACRPYLNDIYPPASPSIQTPFTGGQCYGLGYNFTFTATDATGQRASSQQTSNGRLIGVKTITLSNGNPQAGYESQATEGGPVLYFGLQTVNPGQDPNPVISGVTPRPGTPNDCGDPPPVVTQPGPVADPIGNPFRFNPGPLIDLPIDVTFNPDGTINVDIGTGPIKVDAFNGDRGGGDEGGGGGGGGAPPGDVGSPGDSEATGDGGEAAGEAPEGQVLVGLRAVLTAFPPSRTKLTDEVFRGAYYAYMGVPGLLDLDPAGAAVTLDQFIFAEQPNLTAWRLRTNRGYNATVTPYYRTPE